MRDGFGFFQPWRVARWPLLVLVAAITAIDMLTTPTGWRFIAYGHFLANALPAVLGFATMFAISRSPIFSAIFTGVLLSLFYVANYFMYLHWNQFIHPGHIRLAIADMDVAAAIAKGLTSSLFIAVSTVAVGTVSAAAALLALSRRDEAGSGFPLRLRAVTIMAVGAIFALLYGGREYATAAIDAISSARPSGDGIRWDRSADIRYGLFSYLYLGAGQRRMILDLMQGDASAVLAAAERQAVPAAAAGRPDIVMVLAESMIDPASLRTDLHSDPMAPLRPGGLNNRVAGLARVHVAGGGTWNSEQSLITGIPGTLLGGSVAAPFSLSDENTWTVARALRAQGYRTVALYAQRGDYMLNARDTYLTMGFDSFLDFHDIRDRYGAADGTRDGQLLNAVARTLDEKAGPLFIFAVSFDLHFPYAAKPNGLYLDEAVGTPQIQEYFHRQKGWAKKVAGFIADREKTGGNMLFAMVGDHIPPMPADFRAIGFRDGIEDPLFRTPYLLHSTYRRLDLDMPYVDLGYFAGMVLDQAGQDGGVYFRINSMMRELCEGRFMDCEADRRLLRSYYAYLGQNTVLRTRMGAGSEVTVADEGVEPIAPSPN